MKNAPDRPKHTGLESAGHWLAFALFRTVELGLKLLPLPVVWHAGRILGGLGWLLAGRYRGLVLNNLRIAFGRERDEAWRRDTGRKHFMSLFANVLCGLKLPTMTREQIQARVTLEGMEHMQAALASGKPVLGLVCHLSCWELLAQVPDLCSFGRRPASVYQPLRNPYLDAHILRRRERLGYAIFSRHDGFTGPMRHLKEGGSLGVLVDQHAGDQGVWCPFFDRLASTTPVAAMIALRTGAEVVTLAVYDEAPARWRVVYGPVPTTGTKPTVEGLTAQMNLAVEAMIRRQPHNWFWVHNRWKTPNPRFLIQGERRGIAYAPGYDTARLQPFELLVRSPNWLGDACMAFPAVRAMKAGRPDLRLTVFGPEKLRDLWEAQPFVDRYLGKADREGLLSVARRIKTCGTVFDTGLLLTNSTRSTIELWLGGIQRLVGYPGSFRSRLLRQKIREPQPRGIPQHHALRYLHIAKTIGAPDTGLVPPPPAAVNAGPGPLHIGICAGAEYGQAKRWPLERFAEVIKQVSSEHGGIQWQFFGAPGEAALGEQLSALVGADIPHVNLVGKTKLSELITRLRACRLLVTNDTGTMHLAAALGVPTVSIFGSTEPVLTGPLGSQHTVLRHQVPCSPCFQRTCPFGTYECMTKIQPAQVSTAVLAALRATAL
jgi:lipopolysaccharide heptosyltransferase II